MIRLVEIRFNDGTKETIETPKNVSIYERVLSVKIDNLNYQFYPLSSIKKYTVKH